MILCKEITFLVIAALLFDNVKAVPSVSPLNDDESGPVVETNVGSIRGLVSEDGDYSMFMGIPYAEVDKDNVFGPSIPYPNFENTFNAFDDSAICPQREEFNRTIVGTLDCLHLNVYVPSSANADSRLPVFVSIYGGGFSIGFAGRFLYGPSLLVRHDIILVTLNYRLGPFGFMCPNIPEVPGNQGLRDQIIALRWIRDNIGAFGGDNTRITVGGNSAGGMSTEFHLYYGQDEGLFHRLIFQSGVLYVPRAVNQPDPTAPLKLAEYFNYDTDDVHDALSYLGNIDVGRIIEAASEVEGLRFWPCIENGYDDVEWLIRSHPLNVEIPRSKDIEVLLGFNNDEIYSRLINQPDTFFEQNDFVGNAINADFNFNSEEELLSEMRHIVSNFYFADEDINVELRQQATDLQSDFQFNHPTIRAVNKYINSEVKALYLYLFSYTGGRNFVKERDNIIGGGAVHADELGYLFDISYMEKPMAPEDALIVDRMTEMWANFVKFGNPTPSPTNLVPVLWPAVTRDKCHYLELDTEIRMDTRPIHDRMAFLDLFFLANKEHQIIHNDGEFVGSGAAGNVLGISLPLLLALTLFS